MFTKKRQTKSGDAVYQNEQTQNEVVSLEGIVDLDAQWRANNEGMRSIIQAILANSDCPSE